jgi:PAS domain S-box-containing protein
MAIPLHLLIIEDCEDDAELLLRELRRGGYDVSFLRVDTASDMEQALHSTSWDLLIADYMMPQFSAPRALELVKSFDIDLPFIIVSGKVGEDIAVDSLKAGAHDFIVKGNLTRLIPAIERELREAVVRRERKLADIALKNLSSAVEQTADTVMITNQDGIIEYVNSAFENLAGYSAFEALGKTPSFLRSGAHDEAFYSSLWGTILSGKVFRNEFINRRKNGELYYQEEIITPVRDSKGLISHFVSTGRDVTQRKRQEEKISRQLQRLATLRSIDQAITANLDLSITLDTILVQVSEQLHTDGSAILLRDQQTEHFTVTACVGTHNVRLCSEGCPGEIASRQAVARRETVAVLDLGEMDSVCQGDFKSCYAVPLIVKGNVTGVLIVFSKSALPHDEEWLEFLETLAGQAAIAIDNSSMFHNLERSNDELSLAYDTTLEGWSKALDLRDQETEGHAQRVTDLTVRLAKCLAVDDEELVHIRRGALLHDIGKMGIPDSILRKPGPLDMAEWEIMRKHPAYAYNLLSSISYLEHALDIPFCHHEKWDGSGYPRGLKGNEIPLAARIFAVVDVWDALRSDRPYRKGWPVDKVREYLSAESGVQFDPRIVDAFLLMVREEGGS